MVGDLAVVSSSQFGFAAIDWRRGAVAWTRPAGLHVAPPIARDGSAVLIGDCINPPEVADRLLGCLRIVSAAGADQHYAAIHGPRLEDFAGARGSQAVWLDGERAVRWRRGDRAVSIDLATGLAAPAPIEPPAIRVVYGGHAWDIARTEQRIVARERGVLAWQTERAYTDLVGVVHLPDSAPTLRVTRLGTFGDAPELGLLDIDATGSLNGYAAFPVPAISTLGHAIDATGDTAIGVRMDSSLHHDFVAGYAATARLMYVYPLPDVPRADPVGLAVVPDAVLVFHDGDTFTVLPGLSPPATTAAAPRSTWQNPTP